MAAAPAASPPSADPFPSERTASARMLVAARDLLREGGLGNVTMASIAERAGCSRPAVYQYFPNKEEVVAALAIESSGLRGLLYGHVARFDARPRERLLALAEVDVILYPHWPVLEETTYAVALLSRISPARRDALARAQRIAYDTFQRVVREAIDCGDLVLQPHVSIDHLIFTLATFSTGLFAPISRGLPDPGATRRETAIRLEPADAMRRLGSAFLDGIHWQPLSRDWHYRATLHRVYSDLFPPDFLRELGLSISRPLNQARAPRPRARRRPG